MKQKSKRNNVDIHTRVPPEVHEALTKLADKEGRSLSNCTCQVIKKGLTKSNEDSN